MNNWNKIDLSEIDTPALIVDKAMVEYNIQQAIGYAQGVENLRPHVKTHKTLEVAKMQGVAGIYKFKCATIAEAEMLGLAEAKDVLISYALQGPKIDRLIALTEKYPNTKYSSLIDNVNNVKLLNEKFAAKSKTANVYFDINNGQNRTGIGTKKAKALFKSIESLPNIHIEGVHCYDGHIRMASLKKRIKKTTNSFHEVEKFQEYLEKKLGKKMNVVAGGSPSFSVHAKFHDVECSPGTWIFWDERYASDYEEQAFKKAAVVATRVISKIDEHHYCLDLGHKSVASEFPFPRIKFTSKLKCEQISQSEEHFVIRCKKKNALEVGELLTAFPYHICPTVALYDRMNIVNDGNVTEQWKVIARDRTINV